MTGTIRSSSPIQFHLDADATFARNFIEGATVRELRTSVKGRRKLAENGRKVYSGKSKSTVPAQERPFVSWDGEGYTDYSGVHKYILFGNSRGAYISGDGLSTHACFELLLSEADPNAIHFGFAFNYDVNMILRDLPQNQLKRLAKANNVRWFNYRIEYMPKKWFMLTKTVKGESTTIKIWDIWTFFMTSAVNAFKQYGVTVDEAILQGKAERSNFSLDRLHNVVLPYWRIENERYVELANKLRESLYSADLFISQWHGPGAIASYSLKAHKVQHGMGNCPEEVNNAAQYAYAGGRFELFRFGRVHGPVYQYDIRSAYPHAISQLPDLRTGVWERVVAPGRIHRFGIYRVEFAADPASSSGRSHTPMPFFYRDKDSTIHFPYTVAGWYWAPEVAAVFGAPGVRVVEGYVYHETGSRPFEWVIDAYNTRAQWKRDGNPAQLALKLQLNSLYGKMAQRVGWNEETRSAPKWHQLEWAGWVTSYARARIYRAAREASRTRDLLAVETDAVFSTRKLDTLEVGSSLGQWDDSEYYDDMVYLQSGCYFGLRDGKWKEKYRGFDRGSITLQGTLESLISSTTGPWQISGRTTRFIGFKESLQSKDFTSKFQRWEENRVRLLSVGTDGKRIHDSSQCSGCASGLSPADTLHDLVIARAGGESVPHSLPWKGDDNKNLWQEIADNSKWEVTL